MDRRAFFTLPLIAAGLRAQTNDSSDQLVKLYVYYSKPRRQKNVAFQFLDRWYRLQMDEEAIKDIVSIHSTTPVAVLAHLLEQATSKPIMWIMKDPLQPDFEDLEMTIEKWPMTRDGFVVTYSNVRANPTKDFEYIFKMKFKSEHFVDWKWL